MSKKVKHEEHENHERWLVSYADFMTLLFAFFTSMYAISNLDLQKAGRLVTSTRAAFNSPLMPGGSTILPTTPSASSSAQVLVVPPLFPGSKTTTATAADAEDSDTSESPRRAPLEAYFDDLEQRLAQQLQAQGLADFVALHQRSNELWLTMSEAILFESGQAGLRSESVSGLDGVAAVLASIPEPLRIEGHTDSQAISTPSYPSNWELSTARATALLRYLSDNRGIDPARLSAAGYGPYRPVASNLTADGRAMNRRVELVVVADSARLLHPSPSVENR